MKFRALGAILFFLASRLAAVELPPPPPELKKLLIQELHFRQLTRVKPEEIEIVAGADGESYQAIFGTYLFVLSPDGSFILPGNFFEYAPQLSERERAGLRRQTLAALDQERMILFSPPASQPSLHSITVFTDASCPFCAKFHQEVLILNQEGVAVRYVAFPREGLTGEDGRETASYRKTVSVWCNNDPHGALEQAMLGKRVRPASCENPVEAFFLLGESFGVRGTPAIVFENGDMWTGYYTAIDILEYLGNHYFPPRCEQIR
jgi:thiol:disulfide interchange protein DsbC